MTRGLFLLLALLYDAPPATPSVDGARFERAASLLQPAGREGTLGPWRLLTDVADRPLLAYLDRVAARLPESYRARFGVDAEPRPAEALVLFARDAYTEAGLVVRFLLGSDPARADRFRVFLRAATLGAPAGLDELAAAVGTDAKSFEKEFWSFVRRQ